MKFFCLPKVKYGNLVIICLQNMMIELQSMPSRFACFRPTTGAIAPRNLQSEQLSHRRLWAIAFFRGFRFHNVAPLTSCLLLETSGPWCAPAGWSADLLERRGCAASCRRWDVAPSRRRWARRPYSAAGSPGSTPAAERRYKPVGVYVSHLPVWTRIFGVHPASKF